jgi:hypothetical protein
MRERQVPMESGSLAPVAPVGDVDADQVPWSIKVFVLALLGLLLVGGIAAIEEWPLTGWRLYSYLRGPTSRHYVAYRVGPDGEEHRVNFKRLPDAYSRAPALLGRFPGYTNGTREAVCMDIAEGERGEGRAVDGIRVYQERARLRTIDGEPRISLEERELQYVCVYRSNR